MKLFQRVSRRKLCMLSLGAAVMTQSMLGGGLILGLANAQEAATQEAVTQEAPTKQTPAEETPAQDPVAKPDDSSQEKPKAKPNQKPSKTDKTPKPKVENAEETPKAKSQATESTKPATEVKSDADSKATEATAAAKPQESSVKGTDDTRLDTIESKLDKLVETVEKLAEATAAKPAVEPKPSAAARPATRGRPKPKSTALKVDPNWLQSMPWRSIGPANMGGRVTDLEIHSADPSLWWVATGGGGILKTTSRGASVEHQFDSEATVSIGAIASDPNNKDVLWVGTGEINPRNSVSYGDGVYKSVDGGKTFTNMGLEKTYQIARILVHPENSDVVYVGAAGRLYGTNEERGVYKTTDGGKTWEKILYLDERTGVIDMIMHPEDPDTLIVGMWDRLRDEYDSWPGTVAKPEGIDGYDPIRKWGPKAGLYKTSDGGDNWKKLTKGLPTGMTGRIGLDWQLNDQHAIYAIIDVEDIGKGPKPFAAFLGVVGEDLDGKTVVTQVMPNSPAAKAEIAVGDTISAVDGNDIFEFESLLAALREKKVGERIELTLTRDDEAISVDPILTARPGTRGSGPTVYLGVNGEDAEGKIEITDVVKDGPASEAGLQVGDLIVSAGGEKPKSYSDWIAAVQKLAIGDEVKLSVERGEETIELAVKLGSRPGTPAQNSGYMGIQGRDAGDDAGATLTVVTEDGPSDQAGVKAGDIVTQVGEKKIKSYEDLIAEIRTREAGDDMALVVKRGEATVKIKVTLGDRNAGSSDRPYTFSYFGQLPNVQDQQGANGYQYGGVYKSLDAGETWQRVNSINIRPMYFSVVRVDPNDDQNVYLLGVSQYKSTNGGITFSGDFGPGVHSDSHDLWIDPADGRHMVIGSDGGFYVTYDQGAHWDHINTAAVGQFYHVTISPKQPYWVYGGLQDNGSWGGPAISKVGGTMNEDWINVGGGDGFVCRADPNDPDVVYSESQNGSIRRRNLRTGEGASVRPQAESGLSYRFNWNTPFILSNHNSKIFYSGGNYVFRSLNQGDDLKRISPEITLTQRGSATALSESPVDPDVLYAGTDDGALWVTRDGGNEWKSIHENLGVDPRWVATIEASKAVAGRVYVCLDGHRSDDDNPHIFVSEDFGATFKSLAEQLPRGSTRCLREDVVNPNLLFLGTEFAFWVSMDRGENWTQFNQKLPSVAVHEVAMHSSIDEIVLATHGRSLWACDVSSLRQLKPENLTETAALLPISDVIRWRRDPSRGRTNRSYVSDNPASGAQLWYTLPKAAEEVSLRIEDIEGTELTTLKGKTEPGLHALRWNLVQTSNTGRGGRPRSVANGKYKAVLTVDGKELPAQIVNLVSDPTLASDAISEQEFEAVMAELEASEEEDDSDDRSDLE